MNVSFFLARAILVSILISCISCRKNDRIWRLYDDYDDEISDDIEEQQKSTLGTSRDASLPRTIMPSFRVILLEVSFMAISIYLVNSLENYIQQKSKTVKSKSYQVEEEFLENFRNVLRNFK